MTTKQKEKSDHRTEIRSALTDLFQTYQPSFEEYQWPLESMRWNELIYCILESQGTDLQAKTSLQTLSNLNMLGIDVFVQMDDSEDILGVRRFELILSILEEIGYDRSDAKKAISAVIGIAKKIKNELDGNIQRLLRQEGLLLIQNVLKYLDIQELDPSTARYAVSRWLQNVLNLPIYLETDSMRKFCNNLNTEPHELALIADELDINLAIVDELIEYWHLETIENELLAKEIRAFESAERETVSAQSSKEMG